MAWVIEFYRDKKGKEPVADFFNSLTTEGRARILRLLTLLSTQGVLLKEPYTRQVHGKIRELRTTDRRGEVRILYFAWTGKIIVLLHGFIKKSKKTPAKEIEISQKRMEDYIEKFGGGKV